MMKIPAGAYILKKFTKFFIQFLIRNYSRGDKKPITVFNLSIDREFTEDFSNEPSSMSIDQYFSALRQGDNVKIDTNDFKPSVNEEGKTIESKFSLKDLYILSNYANNCRGNIKLSETLEISEYDLHKLANDKNIVVKNEDNKRLGGRKKLFNILDTLACALRDKVKINETGNHPIRFYLQLIKYEAEVGINPKRSQLEKDIYQTSYMKAHK